MLQIYNRVLLPVWNACTPSVTPVQSTLLVVETVAKTVPPAEAVVTLGTRIPVDKLPTRITLGPKFAPAAPPVLTLTMSVKGCPEGVEVICVVGVLGLRM